MKKLLIVTLLLFISCGPSEEEIQSQIDEAVEKALDTTTTSTTTTTTTTTTSTTTTTTTTSTTTTTLAPTTTTSTTTTTTIPSCTVEEFLTVPTLNSISYEVETETDINGFIKLNYDANCGSYTINRLRIALRSEWGSVTDHTVNVNNPTSGSATFYFKDFYKNNWVKGGYYIDTIFIIDEKDNYSMYVFGGYVLKQPRESLGPENWSDHSLYELEKIIFNFND